MQQVDGRGRVKTLHRNELLPFNSIPVEELQKEQRETEMGLCSNPEPTAPDLLESETSSQSSSSSSEDDEDDKEDGSAQHLQQKDCLVSLAFNLGHGSVIASEQTTETEKTSRVVDDRELGDLGSYQ